MGVGAGQVSTIYAVLCFQQWKKKHALIARNYAVSPFLVYMSSPIVILRAVVSLSFYLVFHHSKSFQLSCLFLFFWVCQLTMKLITGWLSSTTVCKLYFSSYCNLPWKNIRVVSLQAPLKICGVFFRQVLIHSYRCLPGQRTQFPFQMSCFSHQTAMFISSSSRVNK